MGAINCGGITYVDFNFMMAIDCPLATRAALVHCPSIDVFLFFSDHHLSLVRTLKLLSAACILILDGRDLARPANILTWLEIAGRRRRRDVPIKIVLCSIILFVSHFVRWSPAEQRKEC